jgi:hypothetical protein
MRAIINHGRRGTRMETLLKRYEFEHPMQYFDYIIESYINGHNDQAIALFSLMKIDAQKTFLLSALKMGQYGERVRDLIIQNL